MMNKVVNYPQVTLNHIIAFINDASVLVDLQARAITRISLGMFENSISTFKIAIKKGFNLIKVDIYAVENIQKSLHAHNEQRAKESRVNEVVTHEIMRIIISAKQIQFF